MDPYTTPGEALDDILDTARRQALLDNAMLLGSSTRKRAKAEPFPPGDDPGDSLSFPGDEWGPSLCLESD
jgi:hypothetical protein